MTCVKGCCKRTTRAGHERLVVEVPAFLGMPHNAVAQKVAIPPRLLRAYADMTAKVRWPAGPPILEFYDDLHGVGGLFIPGDWVVAVGVRDTDEIADGLLREYGETLTALAREQGQRARVQVTKPRDVVRGAVVGRVMAHELGHALLALGLNNPHAPDVEAGADYWAARLDAARQKDWRLGELIFRAIGCTGLMCTHPSPAVRANVYVEGYRDQMNAA
jgi:hypothetical protein